MNSIDMRIEKTQRRPARRSGLLLFAAASIWGVAFVAQSVGMDYIGPVTFTWARSVIAAVFLVIYYALFHRKNNANNRADGTDWRKAAAGGVICGVLLCSATLLQQFGIMHTSVGKTGFITCFYIIIVPVLGIFLKRRCGLNVWIGACAALVGLYLLSIKEGFYIEKGDLLVFICAFVFAFHIMFVDYFTEAVDSVQLSCIQFITASAVSGILMLITEDVSLSGLMGAAIPLLYAGVMSSGIAYTLQIAGQRGINPAVASLILSLESVVSVIAGFLLLGERLAVRELAGCGLMFAAIIVAQLPQEGLGKGRL